MTASHLFPKAAIRRRVYRVLVLLVVILAGINAASAGEELSAKVDALIAAAAKDASIGPVCDDTTFVRRIYLDLAGRIPSSQEAATFLASTQANKRSVLIDALLAGTDYPHRMRDLFHAMLMERRGDNAEWAKFLETSFEANKPWDQLVREILDPDPDNEAVRGAAYFHTRRLEKVGQQETDYPGLTRDIGRLFLGVDLQCAQCHNHLFIDSYKQVDFQGLFTVYQNTFIRTDLKFPAVGEKVSSKKIEFMSVFDKEPLTTGPRIPFGQEFEIPTFEKDQEYLTPPDRKTNFPGVPRFRALQVIARELAVDSNKAFVDNSANRLWFVMMGRGLVNPLDQQHLDNPPSHPDVLQAVGEELVAQKFDIKWLLRQLALTETYQRTSVLPTTDDVPSAESYRVANEKRLSAEQIMNSIFIATGPREHSGSVEPPPAISPPPAVETTSDAKPAPTADEIRAAFVKAFGNVPQDPEIEFSPSLKSSLFVLNDPAVLDCLTPRPGNLVDRLMNEADSSAVADELYLSVLTRRPTDEERTEVTDYLSKNESRRQTVITNLAWSLLASTEFCLNH